jgi:hypothetical protein
VGVASLTHTQYHLVVLRSNCATMPRTYEMRGKTG